MSKGMRFFLSMVLVLCMFVTLAACGDSQKESNEQTQATAGQTATASETTATTSDTATTKKVEAKEIKLGIIAAIGQPVELACNQFAKEVEEKTEGRVKVTVYPGSTIGNEVELRDAVSIGSVQMASIGLGNIVGMVPEANIAMVYYLWRDRDHMQKAFDGEIGQEWFKKFDEKTGITVIAANWQQGTRETLSKKLFTTPAELNGIKIRVPAGAPISEDLWKAMGSLPVSLAFTEVYTGLEQGVVDAMECPLDYIYQNRFHEKAKNLVLTHHMVYPNLLMINTEFLKSLSEADQKVVKQAAVDAGVYQTKLLLDQEEGFIDKLKAEGVTITEVDTTVFAEAVKPVYTKWEKNWGAGLYERIQNIK